MLFPLIIGNRTFAEALHFDIILDYIIRRMPIAQHEEVERGGVNISETGKKKE